MGKRLRETTAEQRAQDCDGRVAELIETIARAFEHVQREDGVSLHEADVIDSYGTASQRAAARRRDVDTSWDAVPATDLERYDSALSFFDPKGFRYYLPAYMTWALRSHRRSSSPSIDSTLYALALHQEANLRDYQLARFSLLTRAQKSAVAAFLQYMAYETGGSVDERAARDALERYWKQLE